MHHLYIRIFFYCFALGFGFAARGAYVRYSEKAVAVMAGLCGGTLFATLGLVVLCFYYVAKTSVGYINSTIRIRETGIYKVTTVPHEQ